MASHLLVTPAQAGAQSELGETRVPAFAGTTGARSAK